MTVTCPFNSKSRENLKRKSSIGMSFASNNKAGSQCCESTNRKKPDSRCQDPRIRTSLSVSCSQPTHCSPVPAYLYLGVFSLEG